MGGRREGAEVPLPVGRRHVGGGVLPELCAEGEEGGREGPWTQDEVLRLVRG